MKLKVTTRAATLRKTQTALLNEIERLERQAFSIGSHVTGRALNRAKNALGWEMAGDIEQAAAAAKTALIGED